MLKKQQKSDIIFILALFAGFLFHFIYVFEYPYLTDESYYLTIPLRLINGDSLIQHEWNMTQFSSLFQYLPVWLWLQIKGSTDGIIVFMRLIYLCIHTALTVAIYGVFRKYKTWAVLSAIIFYTQTSYKILAINYHSMFIIFMLLFTFCLMAIYEKQKPATYIFAGICYGFSCICNPLFCVVYLLYIVGHFFFSRKIKNAAVKSNDITPNQKNPDNKKENNASDSSETNLYYCFFTKKAISYLSVGVVFVIIIAVTFFFATGGTISSIIKNIPNLFGSNDYVFISAEKLAATLIEFSKISLYMPFLLPALFIALFFDKKRTTIKHRYTYLCLSVLLAFIYIIGIGIFSFHIFFLFLPLPFGIISLVCYILTEKRNKKLFFCMWLPSLISAIFTYLAANSLIASLGVAFVLNNISGVFFVKDLFNEISDNLHNNKLTTSKQQKTVKLSKTLICIGICMQIVFQCTEYSRSRYIDLGCEKISIGPFIGTYKLEEEYDPENKYDYNYSNYAKTLADLDIIKKRSNKDDPVLISSYNYWTYLYIDRPFATYSAWAMEVLNEEQLIKYYEANPEKLPKYIYIEHYSYKYIDEAKEARKVASEMFEFTQENLSNGVLLTVTDYKF